GGERKACLPIGADNAAEVLLAFLRAWPGWSWMCRCRAAIGDGGTASWRPGSPWLGGSSVEQGAGLEQGFPDAHGQRDADVEPEQDDQGRRGSACRRGGHVSLLPISEGPGWRPSGRYRCRPPCGGVRRPDGPAGCR